MARKSRKNLPQPEQAVISVQFPELDEGKYQPQSMDGFRWKITKITKAWKRRLHWCRILLTAAVN